MKSRNLKFAFPIALMTAGLSACGGGSGDNDGSGSVCIASRQSLVSSSATSGSTLTNPDLAVDGNLSTYATITPLPANGGATIRAVGTQHAAGSPAGVAFTTPTAGSFTITITTYLGNVQQESAQAGTDTYGAAGTQNCGGVCENSAVSKESFFGINTSKAYDSIQAQIAVSGSASDVHVLEICNK